MVKIQLGDIFEITTKKGCSYFQCVKIDEFKWCVIKVFNKLYDERPPIESIVNVNDYYFIGFALGAAFKRNLIHKIGNIPLPAYFKLPQYMREKHVIKKRFLGWYIIDTVTWKRQFVETLSSDQKHLSPWGVWNDTLLKERLEEGWSLIDWE